MSGGDEKTCKIVRESLEMQQLGFEEVDGEYSTSFKVKNGTQKANIEVYNTGTVNTGGGKSELKEHLDKMKAGIDEGISLPGGALPFEIDNFPDRIKEKVPKVDPVIVQFLREAITSFKAGSYLACAFMLGAASEKAINILIDTYIDKITTDENKSRISNRVNGRTISKKFEEFEKSFSGCQNKPHAGILAQDLSIIIGSMFHFYRITRNEIGHPQVVPDLDKGIVFGNLGQFVTYIERLYALREYFEKEGVKL